MFSDRISEPPHRYKNTPRLPLTNRRVAVPGAVRTYPVPVRRHRVHVHVTLVLPRLRFEVILFHVDQMPAHQHVAHQPIGTCIQIVTAPIPAQTPGLHQPALPEVVPSSGIVLTPCAAFRLACDASRRRLCKKEFSPFGAVATLLFLMSMLGSCRAHAGPAGKPAAPRPQWLFQP